MATPFLKWAGGKRWFVKNHADLFPETYNRYYEPFLGSGAVFFHLEPKAAILSDANPHLIECYQAIKDDWKIITEIMRQHQHNHCKDYYYDIRGTRFDNRFERAAKFIYLNRTCWNGLRIAEILFDYFDVVKNIWSEAWDTRQKKQVLNRSNGFRALMRAYREIYNEHGMPGGFPNITYIETYLRKSGLRDIDFNTTMFPPGSTGESRLLKVFSGNMSVEDAKALQKF